MAFLPSATVTLTAFSPCSPAISHRPLRLALRPKRPHPRYHPSPVMRSVLSPARDNGTFALVGLNVLAFLADKVFLFPFCRALYLYHASWRPWQLVTSLFFHGSLAHLSGNLFFLLIFGKLVEEVEGPAGVIATFLITGVFANLASLALISGPVVSLGASGAVFGLFVVSVVRTAFSVKGLLKTAILGNFVVNRLIEEGAQTLNQGAASKGMVQTNHIAHLGGAVGGVLLVLALGMLTKNANKELDKQAQDW